MASCDCCGDGVLEIECPFSCRNSSLLKASKKSSFCLDHALDGSIQKAYNYQIQLPMKLCEVDYGDFVVWNESELVILRIG